MRCNNCGSNKSEADSASGTVYCVDCGTVLEENTIVAEVSFGETSGGRAVIQGSFAGDSGRQKLVSLAHGLRLPERYREAGQRYYNLAVVNRFTRGRRSDHVAAINVFTLGSTFLKLCRVLNLVLPHVDPSFYISRFAVALDFGDFTQRVAQDAVRIAQRMDRDWIVTGRRPAGICGACLLMAARMNGFRRTLREMVYVVKVAETTIMKRLDEFNKTESAQLSVTDFRTVWLEKRANPPSFTKNRKKDAESGIVHEEFEDQSVKDMQVPQEKEGKEPVVEDSEDASQTQIASQISVLDEESHISTLVEELGDENAMGYTHITNNPKYAALSEEEKMKVVAAAKAKVALEMDALLNPDLAEDAKQITKEIEEWAQTDEAKKAAKQVEEEEEAEEVEESLSDVDCEEIEAMFLTEEEAALKAKIWYNANKEYLEEMAVRRLVEKDKGIDKHKKKKPRNKQVQEKASTPAQAAVQLMNKAKISKKINKDVFNDMFETPESIEEIKQGAFKRGANEVPVDGYEVVEESGDMPQSKVQKVSKGDEEGKEEDDDDDDDDEEEEEENTSTYPGLDYNQNNFVDYDDYGDDDNDDFY
ncbi:hypothetical protein BY458DRAFT_436724 [Sporodiniella umbellata]|nr:hypothetical protein BY458DRAFT_436724 [Sporodiniella umbellata]